MRESLSRAVYALTAALLIVSVGADARESQSTKNKLSVNMRYFYAGVYLERLPDLYIKTEIHPQILVGGEIDDTYFFVTDPQLVVVPLLVPDCFLVLKPDRTSFDGMSLLYAPQKPWEIEELPEPVLQLLEELNPLEKEEEEAYLDWLDDAKKSPERWQYSRPNFQPHAVLEHDFNKLRIQSPPPVSYRLGDRPDNLIVLTRHFATVEAEATFFDEDWGEPIGEEFTLVASDSQTYYDIENMPKRNARRSTIWQPLFFPVSNKDAAEKYLEKAFRAKTTPSSEYWAAFEPDQLRTEISEMMGLIDSERSCELRLVWVEPEFIHTMLSMSAGTAHYAKTTLDLLAHVLPYFSSWADEQKRKIPAGLLEGK